MVPHDQAWQDALNRYPTMPVDILGSLREEAINEILAKHFQYDNDRYTVQLQQTFNVNGKDRTFTVTMQAQAPISIDLPPYSTSRANPAMERRFADPTGWIQLPDPPLSSQLTTPRKPSRAGEDVNIRVFCTQVAFTFTWPKLDGSGNWSFTPTPLTIVAQGYIELNLTQDGPILHLQVVQIKFDPIQLAQLRQEFSHRIGGYSEGAAIVTDDDCEKKFNDLLVIALNVFGTNYAPKLVHDISLPVPVVANLALNPSLLVLGDKMIVAGITVDRPALNAKLQSAFERTLAAYEAALAEDIQQAGGINAVIFKYPVKSYEEITEKALNNEAEIRDKLPRATAILRTLDGLIEQRRTVVGRYSTFSVSDGLGVGANQDVLSRFASSVMPSPVNQCSDWVSLGLVRGRACWWVHIFNPVVTISGTTVSGQVSIDIGGALEGCVRKFWNCSWSWECGNLSLAIQGSPSVQLSLQSGSGISFIAQFQSGGLSLVTNLPFPFDKIVQALSSLVVQAIVAIANAIAAHIKIDILLPEFTLPEQNTKLKFSDISPFPFTRTSGSFTNPQKTFIGFHVGVTATK